MPSVDTAITGIQQQTSFICTRQLCDVMWLEDDISERTLVWQSSDLDSQKYRYCEQQENWLRDTHGATRQFLPRDAAKLARSWES